MAAAPPVNTVQASLLLCGVPIAPAFDGQSPSKRVAEQIFMDSFETCLSISIEDVKDAITGFTKLPANQGRIPFQPGVKRLKLHLSNGLAQNYAVGVILRTFCFLLITWFSFTKTSRHASISKSRPIFLQDNRSPSLLTFNHNGWIGNQRFLIT